MSKGKLIAIEGLDGSGKATQAKLLAEHLVERGFSVREVTFPDYASDSSALVKMYLAGQFGERPDDVNAYAASSFSASGYPKGTTVFLGSPYTRSVERISRSTCGPVAKTVSK